MRIPLFLLLIVLFSLTAEAQRRRTATPRSPDIGKTAIVADELLSLLRTKPSLFAEASQRLRRGRQVRILAVAEADGVKFFRVAATPPATGWIQSDAVMGTFRAGDEERFARLVQATDGFDQVDLAAKFLEAYPASRFRPAILVVYGYFLEEGAAKMTRDANNRLSRREMAASAAPMHSYYLNFVSLDRYRRLGVTFLFNSNTRQFHYDGASWKELAKKHDGSGEAAEALKRLDILAGKMAKTAEAR
ncbi:MAG: hypothetical protein QUS14_00965 [Pyrinomonadaceae bacterium]|nr:hypothetical protein [Pyrinomonadaceae bacterium]